MVGRRRATIVPALVHARKSLPNGTLSLGTQYWPCVYVNRGRPMGHMVLHGLL
jgi:hypothetical protein